MLEPLRDAFSEAKAKGIIRAHGASIHGLKPLRDCPGTKWMDISLNRVNHNGTKMDSEAGGWNDIGDIPEATSNIRKIHAQGTGVIGMKLIGNGAFTDVTTALGLDFGQPIVAAEWLDYDHDGKADLRLTGTVAQPRVRSTR